MKNERKVFEGGRSDCVVFEIKNGFTGMQRDIVLRLCKLIWRCSRKIVVIIGMCGEHYQWKRHMHFLEGRPQKIATTLQPDSDGCVITKTTAGVRCNFSHKDGTRVIFLNKMVARGIFQWTTRIKYVKAGNDFSIGVVRLPCVRKNFLFGVNGSCGVNLFEDDDCGLCATLTGIRDDDGRHGDRWEGTKLPDEITAVTEADTVSRTLSFVVCGKMMSCAVSEIPHPLQFVAEMNKESIEVRKKEYRSKAKGMYGIYMDRSSITSVSFLRLPSATLLPPACRRYPFSK